MLLSRLFSSSHHHHLIKKSTAIISIVFRTIKNQLKTPQVNHQHHHHHFTTNRSTNFGHHSVVDGNNNKDSKCKLNNVPIKFEGMYMYLKIEIIIFINVDDWTDIDIADGTYIYF